MGKRKLKDWVIPTLAVIVFIGAMLCYYLISNLLNYSVTNDLTYVTDVIDDNTVDVNKEINDQVELKASKPFTSESVNISKNYYDKEADEKKQQESLIQYENIYMPNTGILYSSDAKFDVIASLDGKVTKIKEDKILGFIVEIEHSNSLITVYQSLSEIKVKEGDTVKQGDIIASSGSNKLVNEKDNCLHFEVYRDGNLINPEEFYNLDINTLN